MDASGIVAIIGSIVVPLSALGTLYVNRKFDSVIAGLQARIEECERRHDLAGSPKSSDETKPG